MKTSDSGLEGMSRGLGLSACLVLVLGGAAPVLAQEAMLEEIIVTAERREESLQDTPISIAVFSGAELQQLGVGDVQDLGEFLPNVSIGGLVITNNSPNFVIRGIGGNRSSLGNDRGVGLYIDDVFFSQSTGSILSVLDLERVEVLRGPQGTLFGRNTTGGAIRYISKKPTEEYEGSVRGTVGNLGRTDVRGVLNLPFSDTLAGRFTMASLRRDGQIVQDLDKSDLGGQDEGIVRAQLRWTPSDTVMVDFTADHIEYEASGDPQFIINALNTGLSYKRYAANHPGTGLYTDLVGSPSCEVNLVCTIPGTDWGETIQGQTDIATVTVNWDISDSLSFKSLTGSVDLENISRNDTDLSILPLSQSGTDIKNWRSLSQEFQLTGRGFDDRLRWTAGVYFSSEDGSDYGAGVSSYRTGFGAARTDAEVVEADNEGAFFDFTYDVSDQFSFTAGLRYSADEKSLVTQRTDRQGGKAFSNSEKWDDTFGRLVAEYRPTDFAMIYASYSEGYKAGAIGNSISNDPTKPNANVFPFNEELVETVELGLRSEWLENRLRFNLTFYDTDYSDLQITSFRQVEVAPGEFEAILGTGNAGNVEMDGFELDILVAATDRLSLDFSYAQLNHQIVSIAAEARGTIDLDSLLPRSPKDTWKAGVRYNVPLDSGASLLLRLDHAYTDEQKSFLSDQNSTILPDFGLTNARIVYTEPDGRWSMAVFCTNCTDEYYITAQHLNERQWGGTNTILGRPQLFGVEANVNF